jgi:flavin-dependent dehydrogenase
MRKCEIAVVGAGPAGAVIAWRLAQLGHQVVLIAAGGSSSRTRSESVTPGVAEQLTFLNASRVLDRLRPSVSAGIEQRWHSDRYDQRAELKVGYVVDRNSFDSELRASARSCGVHVLTAVARSARRDAGGWRLECDCNDRPLALQSEFLVDAGGRRGFLSKRRRRKGYHLLALNGRWRGADLPSCIRLASSSRCWGWGTPLAADLYEATIFLDPKEFGGQGPSLEARYRGLVDCCELRDRAGAARLYGPVTACNATPHIDLNAVGEDFIKVGDAALAVDPLSSAGIQIAIQSGVVGAIAVHTLRTDGQHALVAEFWADELARRNRRHMSWSGEFYQRAADHFANSFWCSRSAVVRHDLQPAASVEHGLLPPPALALRISCSLRFADAPCIVGSKIERRSAVTHPRLDHPVAFFGDAYLPELLDQIRPGMNAAAIMHSWMRRVGPIRAVKILSWLWQREMILVNESRIVN